MTEKLNADADKMTENTFTEAMKDAPAFGEHIKQKEKSWLDYYREDPKNFDKLEDALATEIFKGIDNDDYTALHSDKVLYHGEMVDNLGYTLDQFTIAKDGKKDVECVNFCLVLSEKDDRGGYWKRNSDFGVIIPLKDFQHPIVNDDGTDARTEKALSSVAMAVANIGVNSFEGFKKAVENGRLGKIEK